MLASRKIPLVFSSKKQIFNECGNSKEGKDSRQNPLFSTPFRPPGTKLNFKTLTELKAQAKNQGVLKRRVRAWIDNILNIRLHG